MTIDNNYRLTDLPNRRLHDTFHVSRLLPYPFYTNDGDGTPDPNEYFVDRILGRRLIEDADPADPSSYEYRIRWLGTTPRADSWEPIRSLGNAMDAVNAFNTVYPLPIPDLPREEPDHTELHRTTLHRSEWRSRRSRPSPLPTVDEDAPSPAQSDFDDFDDPLNDFPPSPAATRDSSQPLWYSPFDPFSGGSYSPFDPDSRPPTAGSSSDEQFSGHASAPTDDATPPDDAYAAPYAPFVEWICTACQTQNNGGVECSVCHRPRAYWGVDSGHSTSRRSRVPWSSVDISDVGVLRSVYGAPFSHPYGPFRYRYNATYKEAAREEARPVVEFELSRLVGALRQNVWVSPGPNGENLSPDERNRVRAYRIDHPEAHPPS